MFCALPFARHPTEGVVPLENCGHDIDIYIRGSVYDIFYGAHVVMNIGQVTTSFVPPPRSGELPPSS